MTILLLGPEAASAPHSVPATSPWKRGGDTSCLSQPPLDQGRPCPRLRAGFGSLSVTRATLHTHAGCPPPCAFLETEPSSGGGRGGSLSSRRPADRPWDRGGCWLVTRGGRGRPAVPGEVQRAEPGQGRRKVELGSVPRQPRPCLGPLPAPGRSHHHRASGTCGHLQSGPPASPLPPPRSLALVPSGCSCHLTPASGPTPGTRPHLCRCPAVLPALGPPRGHWLLSSRRAQLLPAPFPGSSCPCHLPTCPLEAAAGAQRRPLPHPPLRPLLGLPRTDPCLDCPPRVPLGVPGGWLQGCLGDSAASP